MKRERQPLKARENIGSQITHGFHSSLGQQVSIAISSYTSHQHDQWDKPGGPPQYNRRYISSFDVRGKKVTNNRRNFRFSEYDRKYILNHERQAETSSCRSQNPRHYSPGYQVPLGNHIPHQKRLIN